MSAGTFTWPVPAAGGDFADSAMLADIAVGAPFAHEGFADNGAAYVFEGDDVLTYSGDPATQCMNAYAVEILGDAAGHELGTDVQLSSDVTMDNLGELFFGAPGGAGGNGEAGVFVSNE